MAKTFYITTTLPYVNADPHVGFAMEIIRADSIARYKKLQGFDVFFNTGTDEHGLKIYQKAEEVGMDTKAFVDQYAARFKDLLPALHISGNAHFIRTTDEHHKKAAQEFWRRCKANGDIEKKQYKIKYCVGCELEKTESELVDGKCPLHPNLKLEIREEENYFFRFSKYQQKLLDFYKKYSDFVIPDFRFNEIKAFVERGLEDFSISRLKTKMPWGVAVPDDPNHVMYVWFDALVNYISTLGWSEDETNFKKYWQEGTPTQYCGKDNLRQQSAMWQAMLMSAGLPNSRHIIINGFITSGGQKMSKSIGNVINPFDLVTEYSADALRYYVLRELSPFEDSDMTPESFKNAYNANLANGLGNLVSRIMKMAETHLPEPIDTKSKDMPLANEYVEALETFNIKNAMDIIWGLITALDQSIQTNKPFSLVKTDPEKGKALIKDLVFELAIIAKHLIPVLPETAKTIQSLIAENKSPVQPLFLRKD
ncbi:methionine--tRNA ligase [Candidatus Parcubacteria bacterium]|nr:methionine--tRNA ligase [Candidatus Parcubacteria bacterium]